MTRRLILDSSVNMRHQAQLVGVVHKFYFRTERRYIMADFKKGDVVYLNSDPTMKFTVHSIINFRGETQIELVYFNQQNNRFEYPKFAPELLTLVNKEG